MDLKQISDDALGGVTGGNSVDDEIQKLRNGAAGGTIDEPLLDEDVSFRRPVFEQPEPPDLTIPPPPDGLIWPGGNPFMPSDGGLLQLLK